MMLQTDPEKAPTDTGTPVGAVLSIFILPFLKRWLIILVYTIQNNRVTLGKSQKLPSILGIFPCSLSLSRRTFLFLIWHKTESLSVFCSATSQTSLCPSCCRVCQVSSWWAPRFLILYEYFFLLAQLPHILLPVPVLENRALYSNISRVPSLPLWPLPDEISHGTRP